MYLSFTDARAFSPPTHTMPMSDGELKLPTIGCGPPDRAASEDRAALID